MLRRSLDTAWKVATMIGKFTLICSLLEQRMDRRSYLPQTTHTNMNRSIIAEKYKKRWGIKTSYRVKSELRLKTCSRKYVVRLFMFVLSVLLYNAWVLLNLLYGFFKFLVVFANPVIGAQAFLALVLTNKLF